MDYDDFLDMAYEMGIAASPGSRDAVVKYAQAVYNAGVMDERKHLNQKIAALEQDVDHFFKLSGEYLERANKAEEAVVTERERCAALCEKIGNRIEDERPNRYMGDAALECAEAIRKMK